MVTLRFFCYLCRWVISRSGWIQTQVSTCISNRKTHTCTIHILYNVSINNFYRHISCEHMYHLYVAFCMKFAYVDIYTWQSIYFSIPAPSAKGQRCGPSLRTGPVRVPNGSALVAIFAICFSLLWPRFIVDHWVVFIHQLLQVGIWKKHYI